jgi:hypothetical protein
LFKKGKKERTCVTHDAILGFLYIWEKRIYLNQSESIPI